MEKAITALKTSQLIIWLSSWEIKEPHMLNSLLFKMRGPESGANYTKTKYYSEGSLWKGSFLSATIHITSKPGSVLCFPLNQCLKNCSVNWFLKWMVVWTNHFGLFSEWFAEDCWRFYFRKKGTSSLVNTLAMIVYIDSFQRMNLCNFYKSSIYSFL